MYFLGSISRPNSTVPGFIKKKKKAKSDFHHLIFIIYLFIQQEFLNACCMLSIVTGARCSRENTTPHLGSCAQMPRTPISPLQVAAGFLPWGRAWPCRGFCPLFSGILTFCSLKGPVFSSYPKTLFILSAKLAICFAIKAHPNSPLMPNCSVAIYLFLLHWKINLEPLPLVSWHHSFLELQQC